MKIGSLCTGYGGLDLAVEAHFNAETIWCAEFDKQASHVIEQRFGIPNYGDIKSINWSKLEPIDILTAGYPCQPFSHAGQRKGLNDERHIFPFIMQAVSILRPKILVLENVRGHLSLGFNEVLKALAQHGYNAIWKIVRASDAGAPHQRARLFIIAYSINCGCAQRNAIGFKSPQSKPENNGCITNSDSHSCEESRRAFKILFGSSRKVQNQTNRNEYRFSPEMDRQEVPDTLDKDGKLNTLFVEYMMGLPVGWVTNCGLTRAQQLKMLGNGVVPQQAKLALELLTNG